MNSRRAQGHEKFIPAWIKRTQNKVKTKKKKIFSSKISTNSGYCLKIHAIFNKFLSEDQKKKILSQNIYEIRYESTKITKIWAVKTNLKVLGLELHSNSPEPVNFFGAQSSVLAWGSTIFIWGGTSSHLGGTQWRQVCFKIRL